MYNDQYQRVGIAKTAWRNGHRRVYGIFEHPDNRGRLYAKYEGYNEQRPDGVAQVGLPLGGPRWRPEPLIDFQPAGYDFVHFFAQHRRPNPYIVRIPRDRVEYGPYPDERKAKAFARIGSQHGAPREVYYAPRDGGRRSRIRRYEGGNRVWPRENPWGSGATTIAHGFLCKVDFVRGGGPDPTRPWRWEVWTGNPETSVHGWSHSEGAARQAAEAAASELAHRSGGRKNPGTLDDRIEQEVAIFDIEEASDGRLRGYVLLTDGREGYSQWYSAGVSADDMLAQAADVAWNS